MGSRNCDDCRKRVSKIAPIVVSSYSESRGDDPPESLDSLNQYLGAIEETPLNKAKLSQSTEYSKQKIERTTTPVKKTMCSLNMMREK